MPLTLSSVLLGIQALPITLFGGLILYEPAKAGFDDVPPAVAHVLGFSSLSLGAAYFVTMFQSKRARHHFLLASIPLRTVAAYVFSTDGNEARGAPVWDYGNAFLSAVVVAVERLAYLSA